MASKSNVTGIILAGGVGRRVGYRDKGLIPWQGKPLIAHVLDCLRPQVTEVLISCNRNFSRYQEFAELTVADTRREFQGPLAGLEAAIPHIKTELLVVVGCDMPHLPDNFVTRLVAPLRNTEGDAAQISYAHDGLRAQYLCAAMRRDCLHSLSSFLDEGHRAVKEFYKCQLTTSVDFSDQRGCFVNYNTLV
jgi:molybdopterin-guanine dinucleotide biosynthesis protein A